MFADFYIENIEGMNKREYDIQKSEEELGMSSLVVSYNNSTAYIGSDSRVTKNKKYFDFYPKIYRCHKGLIGIVGIMSKIDVDGEKEFGEEILNIKDNVMQSLVSLSYNIMSFLPEGKNTVIVALLQNGLSLDWYEIGILHNKINITKKEIEKERTIYGVKYAQFTQNVMSEFDKSEEDGIRKIIEIDKKCDEISRPVATVGGPIQLYEINPFTIKDLSDYNAPKDFSKYYEWKSNL